MEELIKYLEKTYQVTKEDLDLPDGDRFFLMGQLSMIDDIKEIYERGYPDIEDES